MGEKQAVPSEEAGLSSRGAGGGGQQAGAPWLGCFWLPEGLAGDSSGLVYLASPAATSYGFKMSYPDLRRPRQTRVVPPPPAWASSLCLLHC